MIDIDNNSALHELAEHYGTDKLEHGYIDFYVKNLPLHPRKLLEIGVKNGASIAMWKAYFPETEIHGLDLFIEFPQPDIPGVTWHKGNQCDWYLLEMLRKENFDVIIDDGSHNARDQMYSFFGLFNGGHYFIEDIHCNRDEFYRQGLPYWFTADVLFDAVRHTKIRLNDVPIIKHGGNIMLIKQ